MTIQYKLSQEDYNTLYLYIASKSPQIRKRMRISWIFFSIVFAILTFYYFNKNSLITAGITGLFTISYLFFYPVYHKWRYRKNFEKQVEKDFGNKFNQQQSLHFGEKDLVNKDESGESKTKISEIQGVVETGTHFFIQAPGSLYYIIPKKKPSSKKKLKNKFHELGWKVVEDLNWKW